MKSSTSSHVRPLGHRDARHVPIEKSIHADVGWRGCDTLAVFAPPVCEEEAVHPLRHGAVLCGQTQEVVMVWHDPDNGVHGLVQCGLRPHSPSETRGAYPRERRRRKTASRQRSHQQAVLALPHRQRSDSRTRHRLFGRRRWKRGPQARPPQSVPRRSRSPAPSRAGRSEPPARLDAPLQLVFRSSPVVAKLRSTQFDCPCDKQSDRKDDGKNQRDFPAASHRIV